MSFRRNLFTHGTGKDFYAEGILPRSPSAIGIPMEGPSEQNDRTASNNKNFPISEVVLHKNNVIVHLS